MTPEAGNIADCVRSDLPDRQALFDQNASLYAISPFEAIS